jgi:hypothetical protein
MAGRNVDVKRKSQIADSTQSFFSPICIFYSCLPEADGALKFSMIFS